MPDGTLGYTRDGSFQVSAEGELVTASGYKVQPGISIPDGAQSITIGTDGTVSVQIAGQTSADADRHAAADRFRQSRRPAGARREPAARVAASGPAQTGTPGLERPRHARSRARSRARTSTWSRSS
jgi:flagellar basal-body rod protein FlgG